MENTQRHMCSLRFSSYTEKPQSSPSPAQILLPFQYWIRLTMMDVGTSPGDAEKRLSASSDFPRYSYTRETEEGKSKFVDTNHAVVIPEEGTVFILTSRNTKGCNRHLLLIQWNIPWPVIKIFQKKQRLEVLFTHPQVMLIVSDSLKGEFKLPVVLYQVWKSVFVICLSNKILLH